jgi:hypothetical protein
LFAIVTFSYRPKAFGRYAVFLVAIGAKHYVFDWFLVSISQLQLKEAAMPKKSSE